VTQAVKERFDAEGISIPFPQRDIHVYKEALPASSGTPQRGNEGWIASTGPAAQEHAPTGNESA
jgi:small-conductance mechanosensitive channel